MLVQDGELGSVYILGGVVHSCHRIIRGRAERYVGMTLGIPPTFSTHPALSIHHNIRIKTIHSKSPIDPFITLALIECKSTEQKKIFEQSELLRNSFICNNIHIQINNQPAWCSGRVVC